MVSLSGDGMPGNTGCDNGAFRLFEELIGREVQWLICTLHLNELVFRKLFIALGKKYSLIFSLHISCELL